MRNNNHRRRSDSLEQLIKEGRREREIDHLPNYIVEIVATTLFVRWYITIEIDRWEMSDRVFAFREELCVEQRRCHPCWEDISMLLDSPHRDLDSYRRFDRSFLDKDHKHSKDCRPSDWIVDSTHLGHTSNRTTTPPTWRDCYNRWYSNDDRVTIEKSVDSNPTKNRRTNDTNEHLGDCSNSTKNQKEQRQRNNKN